MALGKAMSGLQVNFNDAEAKTQYIEKVENYIDAINADFDAYGSTISGDEDQKNLDAVKTAYTAYLDIINQNLAIAKNGGTADETLANMSKAASVAQDAATAFESLAEYNNSRAQKDIANSEAAASTAMLIVVAFIVVSLVIALLLGLSISKNISIPIQRFATLAKMLADGDTDFKNM